MKKIFFFIVLLFFLQGNTIKKNTANNEIRIALLMGNAKYGGGDDLKNPINDAIALEKALKDCGFETTRKENLNLEQMNMHIKEFVKKINEYKKNSNNHVTALVYFSGHGMQHENNNYLIPIGADLEFEEYVKTRTQSVDELTKLLKNADFRLLMIDACRNNPFAKSWTKDLPTGFVEYNPPATQHNININLVQGTFISFAAAPGTKALDGTGNNSPYIESFLEMIAQKEQPRFCYTKYDKIQAVLYF